MKIISFDVGIKNMAYCILEISSDIAPSLTIVDWKTINLMNEEDTTKPEMPICSCNNKPKKGVVSKCSRYALYTKSVAGMVSYFCNKHAKEATGFILPEKVINTHL